MKREWMDALVDLDCVLFDDWLKENPEYREKWLRYENRSEDASDADIDEISYIYNETDVMRKTLWVEVFQGARALEKLLERGYLEGRGAKEYIREYFEIMEKLIQEGENNA